MEYPVWWIPSLSGGLLIACMAVFHVFVAHFAVGGGLFLVLTERMGHKQRNPQVIDYVKRHTKFFLLLTMVAGGMTGVGIWFTISLLTPPATSVLVHSFGFGWATEWTFFLCEIVALIIYHYTFSTMNRRDHMIVGWLYFFFAYMSLFVINGIITMMLTPGEWLQTRSFWDGFFNPTFWPSLALRSALCFMFAGLFAMVTAIRIKDVRTRERMVRYAAKWIAAPFLLLVVSSLWYLNALPEAQYSMLLARSAQTPHLVKLFLPLSAVVMLLGVAVVYVYPAISGNGARIPLVALLVVAGLGQMGTFEWIREAGRRPYLIHGHMWSSSIKVDDMERINTKGALTAARWTSVENITPENRLTAGRELYKLQCLACHSIEGPMLAAEKKTSDLTERGLVAQFTGQGKLRPYMPPFFGTEEERMALAAFIAETIHTRNPDQPEYTPAEIATLIPGFDKHESEYVLVAWATHGMTTISDNNAHFTMQPPGSNIRAQLVRRDVTPQLIEDGVTISYSIEEGFENPSRHVRFWEFVEGMFGKDLALDVGLTGNTLNGVLETDPERRGYTATMLPVLPYSNDGKVNPYPVVKVEAYDDQGRLLAATRAAIPASTEWGCRKCHDGGWRVNDVTGISDETAQNILSVHDKINNTALVQRAANGNPALCQECHESPKLNKEGRENLISFSAAVHGWHANYLTNKDDKACTTCHPGAEDSITQGLRGLHADRGLTCVNCHGTLEDHALGLLKNEEQKGKRVAHLRQHLTPRYAESFAEVKPRTSWLSEPTCDACHDFFSTPPPDASAAHQWTSGDPSELYSNRQDFMGAIQCQGCHGPTHALYPAHNAYGTDRNNIIPMQYMNLPGPLGSSGNCICHTIELPMEASAHHPIMP